MLEFFLRGQSVTPFIVIGVVGLALVVLSLVLGEVFEGLLGGLDLDVGGGLFSAPVLGSFLASFGFGAALIIYTTGAGAAVGAVGGLASGLVVGGVALGMMRSLVNMPTDETVTTSSLTGAAGVVITAIPADGFGEVTIRHHGSQHKYNARATDGPIPAGAPVRVTAVLSASAVQVEPA
ncbi:NfeD family protein [Egicoccus halophilus]|nr:NfeD family protein [Egicoccus halophilus]